MINVNQITSKLAVMPDMALKQFAEMHKEDPYSFSLAIAESNRRKQIRSQVPPMQEQPKVADQEISSMTRLPEEVGIGALPVDMNMASGGIVAFGPGGDVKGKENQKDLYRQYALNKAEENGLPPSLVDSIFQIESGYDPEAQSPTGPQGIGQLTKRTGAAYGVKPEDRKDPYKNIDASIAFMKDLNKKYKGDPALIAVGYNQGEGVLNENLRKNEGRLNPASLPNEAQGYLKKLNTLYSPAPPPVAETAPVSQEVDRSVSGQAKRIGQGLAGIYNRVTGSSEPAPQAAPQQTAPERVVDGYIVDASGIPIRRAGEASASPAPRDDRSIFERGADVIGIPKDFQRNFSTNLNAVGGGFGGAPRVFKAAPSGAKALEEAVKATPEAVAAAAAATQKVANVRLAKPAAQGIETLTPEAQALRVAAENAKMARNLKADKDAAALAQKSVDSANLASKSVGEAARLVDATKAAQVNKANKVVNAARVNSAVNAAFGQDGVEEPAQPITPEQRNTTAASMQSMQDALNRDTEAAKKIPKPEDLSKKEKKEVIDLAKENAPAKTKGFTNDDWLQFGLSLMAGTSRYALQNVGTAGMAALAGKKEREKEERAIAAKVLDKTDMTKVIDRLMKDDPKLSYRDAYEVYQSGKTNAELLARGLDIKGQDAISRAVKVYQQAKEAIDSSIIGITGRSATATPAQKQAYADALAALGKNPAETVAAAPAAATMPLPGAKIVGSRPA
jgi:hypothetical protein